MALTELLVDVVERLVEAVPVPDEEIVSDMLDVELPPPEDDAAYTERAFDPPHMVAPVLSPEQAMLQFVTGVEFKVFPH